MLVLPPTRSRFRLRGRRTHRAKVHGDWKEECREKVIVIGRSQTISENDILSRCLQQEEGGKGIGTVRTEERSGVGASGAAATEAHHAEDAS